MLQYPVEIMMCRFSGISSPRAQDFVYCLLGRAGRGLFGGGPGQGGYFEPEGILIVVVVRLCLGGRDIFNCNTFVNRD